MGFWDTPVAKVPKDTKPKDNFWGVSSTKPTPVLAKENRVPDDYFYGQTPRGYTFGRADELDTSGRPFLAYREPGATSTTTDKTRVATKFSPILPKPQVKDLIVNPRGIANEQAVRSSLGYKSGKDELDHKIALAVSGSNDPINLRVIAKEDNNDGQLARQLLNEVSGGKKSLFQAQSDFAITKKIALPVTGSKYGEYKLDEIKAKEEARKANNFWGILKNTAKGLLKVTPKQQEAVYQALPGVRAIVESVKQGSLAPEKEYLKQSVATATGYHKDEGGQYVPGTPQERLKASNTFAMGFIGGPEGRIGKNLVNSLTKQGAFNANKYIAEQVTKRAEAKVGGGLSFLGKTKSFLANAKAKLVDFTAPIEDTLAEAQKKSKFSLLPEHDIHNQIDRVLRTPTLAGQFAKDNGIVDVIKTIDDPDALDQYLIAKHAIELDTRGIATGRNLAKDQALIKALGTKYEAEAQKVGNYSKKLLDYSVETGLVSKETAEMLKARYPDYVPFNRVFSEAEEQATKQGGRGVASLSRQTAVQSIKGSEREIESPLQSLLAKTNDVFKQGEKNQAARLLASYEKLPNNPFQLKELTGFEETLASGKTRPFKVFQEADKDTISFFDNGKKRVFQTTPEIAQAAKALNVQQLNILGKIFALPTRLARLGITGINLPFVGANIARDQVTGFINSTKALQTSIANPPNFVKALFSALKHDELYDEMVRAGGAGTSYDISRNQAEQTFGKIRASRGLLTRGGYIVRHPSELLRAVENIIGRAEEFTRIQQYRGTKEALLKEGFDVKNATIGGARQARDATVNFARRGEWGTVLNAAFLYLNASIQGTRTLLRGLKTRPVATASKIAISVLFPVAVATTWNLGDPERKKAYEDIAEYEKENNIIIVPPNPTKDENGNWNVIKIPLSQEINNLTGLVRRPIESAQGLAPLKFSDFSQALLGSVSPIDPTKGAILSSLTPQAIKPTLEGAVNRNLFTGYPQVSLGLEKLSPEKQIKDSTSKLAIKLGQQLGVSPIKIDAFIKGTFGGVGQQLTGQQNVMEAVFARFGKARGGGIENKFYEQERAADQKRADTRADFKSSTYDKVQELLKSNPEEADRMVRSLTKEQQELYVSIRTAERAKNTEKLHDLIQADPVEAVKFVRNQNKREQARLMERLNDINSFTREERALYVKGKSGIIQQ